LEVKEGMQITFYAIGETMLMREMLGEKMM